MNQERILAGVAVFAAVVGVLVGNVAGVVEHACRAAEELVDRRALGLHDRTFAVNLPFGVAGDCLHCCVELVKFVLK